MEDQLVQIRSPEGSEVALGEHPKPGVYIRTYGCQMNEYDTQKLYKLMEGTHRAVKTPQDAELILVNTCSVRDKPEQKVYSVVGELSELKRNNPKVLIGVGGCVAQQEGEAILKRSKAVDFVFGTHNLSLVPSLIKRRREGFGRQAAVDYRDEWEELPLGFAGDGRTSVFVSISRGCNKACSYCIVPRTRGPEVSRAREEILREVRIAVHRGAREVTLLGQTVNSWGRDLSPRQSFVSLLDEVAQVDGLQRIRFTSPHPQEIREDFIDLITTNKKICHHVHMPLQSGSDAMLKAMNRNYRRQRYLEIVKELQRRVPDIALTTDIIFGFPGECEEDFLQTLELLNIVRFDSSYSYIFSPRPGTAAAELERAQPELVVPEAIKLDRLYRFQARQNEITNERLVRWVGKTAEVLFEGPSTSDPAALQGRSSQNITVNLLAAEPSIRVGDIVPVKIEQANRYTLSGRADVQSQSIYSPTDSVAVPG